MQDNLKETLELYFTCKNLADKDTFSKSDPSLKLSIQNLGANYPVVIGLTETIQNSLNPEFKKALLVEYLFETQ